MKQQYGISRPRGGHRERGVLSTVMGRPCGRALRLFNVVLHHVRCQKLPVLLLRGPPGDIRVIFGIFGRRIGPGGGYLTYPGDGPDVFLFSFFS